MSQFRFVNSNYNSYAFVVLLQLLSHLWLFVTPCQASLSFTSSQNLLKFMSTELVMLSNHPILCHLPLFLSIFPSIRVFSNELALHIRLPKYWTFSFSISPSTEYSELMSFRIDWFNLLAVRGTLESLLQHHNSKFWITWSLAFFMAHEYWKNHSFGYGFLSAKWCLCFVNMLSRFIIVFLPRSTHLLISRCCHHLEWFWNTRI